MELRKIYRLAPLLVITAGLLASCSNNKNTGWSRFYHSFTTRYNVYFNGIENYKEQLKVQQEKYEDDFTDILYLNPAEAYNNPKDPQPQGSFDRTIEKCQKGYTKSQHQKQAQTQSKQA